MNDEDVTAPNLDAIERSHPDYERKMAEALTSALADLGHRSTITAGEIEDWITKLFAEAIDSSPEADSSIDPQDRADSLENDRSSELSKATASSEISTIN